MSSNFPSGDGQHGNDFTFIALKGTTTPPHSDPGTSNRQAPFPVGTHSHQAAVTVQGDWVSKSPAPRLRGETPGTLEKIHKTPLDTFKLRRAQRQQTHQGSGPWGGSQSHQQVAIYPSRWHHICTKLASVVTLIKKKKSAAWKSTGTGNESSGTQSDLKSEKLYSPLVNNSGLFTKIKGFLQFMGIPFSNSY